MNFRGEAKRLDDIDLPRIGAQIGVGEDELHMILEVECAGTGFDRSGRPRMLFEPHVFWRELGPGKARDRAAAEGLAYSRWGQRSYPADSYPRLALAMAIDETAALKASSWGLGQILGVNHTLCGFDSPQAMVRAMLHDEERHLAAIVAFLVSSGIDDDLRRLAALTRATTPDDCRPIARVYNGAGYERHGYHTRMAKAHNRWRAIPDTAIDAVELPAPPPQMRPLLVYGSSGEWVRELQQLLGQSGIKVEVDGRFGPATLVAVRAFQEGKNLDVDGRVGPRTWAELDDVPVVQPAPFVVDGWLPDWARAWWPW